MRSKRLRDGDHPRLSDADDAWEREQAFQRAIFAIPLGKVSTYGQVAEAAGYPGYHRAVARLLRGGAANHLPWHRVVGAGGVIKTAGETAQEQRARLLEEGVPFLGEKVNVILAHHRH